MDSVGQLQKSTIGVGFKSENKDDVRGDRMAWLRLQEPSDAGKEEEAAGDDGNRTTASERIKESGKSDSQYVPASSPLGTYIGVMTQLRSALEKRLQQGMEACSHMAAIYPGDATNAGYQRHRDTSPG